MSRKLIFDLVNSAGREMSANSVMFHSLVAEHFGLTITDWRAWDMVLREGPLTASGLAERTGLTPGAVTGLIDRLVKAGAVRRMRDLQDRRKVMVCARESSSRPRVADALFSPLLASAKKLYREYSDDQLRTIAGFMTRMAALLRDHTADFQKTIKVSSKRR